MSGLSTVTGWFRRRPRLLMILGAGSSVATKMPSVGELNSLMLDWSRQWDPGFPCDNFYAKLWEHVERYYSAEPKRGLTPNFEIVLGAMLGLAHWLVPAPYGNPLRECIGASGADAWRFTTPHPYAPTCDLNAQAAFLLKQLAGHMRERSRGLDTHAPAFQRYAALLERPRGSFAIGIYNLNYDTVALAASPGIFTGFDTNGIFDARSVHDRRAWGFLYHMHGSVHHTLTGTFGEDIRWHPNLGGSFEDGPEGLSPDERSERKSFPRTTLIAGGFKLDQLLIEPFQTYYASLVRHVTEADAIIIGGYGFGDEHVNRVLQNRCSSPMDRPRIAVLARSADHDDSMACRADDWSAAVRRTLHVIDDFREVGHIAPPLMRELCGKGGFEIATRSKVAIWHGGFSEIFARLDAFVAWLAGKAGDDVLRTPDAPDR